MKILVTGGLGFIGSSFIRYMIKEYDGKVDITNLDKVTYCSNFDSLKDAENKKNYRFVKGDISDYGLLEKTAKDAEIIFNFAAETHVDRSIRSSLDFVKSNVLGFSTLLEFARRNGIKKIVHISTDEVYGSIDSGSFNEDSNLLPNSPYAATKASADLMARAYIKTYGIPVITTRSSNNFGPYQYPEKVIPLFITNILENRKIPLYGDGMNVRDWLYVEDNCAAIDLVSRKGRIYETYNVGAKNEKTNIEVARFILKEMGKDESYIKFVKDRPAHDRRYSLNCSKIGKLGFKPKNNFYDALKKTIQWYKDNKEWWKKIKSIKSYETKFY